MTLQTYDMLKQSSDDEAVGRIQIYMWFHDSQTLSASLRVQHAPVSKF